VLSERENEIIILIAEGLTNEQIAEQLFLSKHTINTHRKNIMSKLGVKNTAGIVMYAVKMNLISPNKFLFAPTV
jgi:DNA-binding NarL/FixJ family response regulator